MSERPRRFNTLRFAAEAPLQLTLAPSVFLSCLRPSDTPPPDLPSLSFALNIRPQSLPFFSADKARGPGTPTRSPRFRHVRGAGPGQAKIASRRISKQNVFTSAPPPSPYQLSPAALQPSFISPFQVCGILGLLSHDPSVDVSHEICEGLSLLQHRGQDACGIVTCGPKGRFYQCKANGMVRDVFDTTALSRLIGGMGIGHGA